MRVRYGSLANIIHRKLLALYIVTHSKNFYANKNFLQKSSHSILSEFYSASYWPKPFSKKADIFTEISPTHLKNVYFSFPPNDYSPKISNFWTHSPRANGTSWTWALFQYTWNYLNNQFLIICEHVEGHGHEHLFFILLTLAVANVVHSKREESYTMYPNLNCPFGASRWSPFRERWILHTGA